MRGRNHLLAVGTVAAIILAWPNSVRADPFRDPMAHFTVNPPRGWQPFSKAEVKQANANLAARRGKTDVECLAAYRRHAGTLPCVIVAYQAGDASGTTSSEWEHAAGESFGVRMKEAQGAFADVVKSLSVGEAGYDRAKKRFLFRLTAKVADGTELELAGVGHIGARGVLILYFYSIGPMTARDLAAFEKMNDSLQFDPGFEYVPAEQRPTLWQKLSTTPAGGVANPLLVGGGVAAAVLVVGGLGLVLGRKPTPAPHF